MNTTPSFNNQPHTVIPGLNIEKHYQKITIDLDEYGMNESLVRNGNPEHLLALLMGVLSTYLDELETLKEAVKNEAVNEINKCQQQVIHIGNKLRHILENLIPETGDEIAETKVEIEKLQERSPDEFEDLNSGFNTSLISEAKKTILTFKKNIRELKSKAIALESEIEQLKNQETQLLANIESFEPYSRKTLDHKLNSFFRGWLKGLEMANAPTGLTTEANEIFSSFITGLDSENEETSGLRNVA